MLKPAGLEASKGLVTTQFLKQPGDPAWANDDEVKAYKDFLKKYAPSANPDDYSVLVAYMNVHAIDARPEEMRRSADPGKSASIRRHRSMASGCR